MFEGRVLFLEGVEEEGKGLLKMLEIEGHGEELLNVQVEIHLEQLREVFVGAHF